MREYCISYMEESYSDSDYVTVMANSAAEAYDKAVYEVLNRVPYAAFVQWMIQKNGDWHIFFQNCYGKPY